MANLKQEYDKLISEIKRQEQLTRYNFKERQGKTPTKEDRERLEKLKQFVFQLFSS